MSVRLIHGDALEAMRALAAEGVTVEAIVTDPPAGIGFMNRSWDDDLGGREQWVAWMTEVAAAALQCIKPGGHALVWSLPRTSHWTAWAWETAGWGPRDRLAHIFGSGFPKSLDVSKALDKMAGAEREVVGAKRKLDAGFHRVSGGGRAQPEFYRTHEVPVTAPATEAARQWQGWGTHLKPAIEDWWLFRAPLSEKTVAENVLKHGVGALHVDACRVATSEVLTGGGGKLWSHYRDGTEDRAEPRVNDGLGRWPPNVIHSGDEEVLAAFAAFGEGKGAAAPIRGTEPSVPAKGDVAYGFRNRVAGPFHADTGTAARFFPALPFSEDELRFMYHPKASRKERGGSRHPTVKPLALMRWLCRLVTPPGGTVLDPFAGSGTTGEAALLEGFNAILIEREAEYQADIAARLERARAALPLFAAAE